MTFVYSRSQSYWKARVPTPMVKLLSFIQTYVYTWSSTHLPPSTPTPPPPPLVTPQPPPPPPPPISTHIHTQHTHTHTHTLSMGPEQTTEENFRLAKCGKPQPEKASDVLGKKRGGGKQCTVLRVHCVDYIAPRLTCRQRKCWWRIRDCSS